MHRDRDRRRQEGQGDATEPLQGAGAVDRCRLVDVLRDRLQRGEQRDREERDAPPDVGDDRPPHRVVRIGEDVLGRRQDAERANSQCGSGPTTGLNSQAQLRPDRKVGTAQGRNTSAWTMPVPETAVQEEREHEAEHELEDDGGEGPQQTCCRARARKPASVQSVAEMLQSRQSRR